MYYNFIYPEIRINPEYNYDEVLSGYNYNFQTIDSWQISGVTIGGVTLTGSSIIAPSGGTIGGVTLTGSSIFAPSGGTLGAVTFKRGSASDGDNLIEIENGLGNLTAFISASGRTTTTNLTISGLTEVSGYSRQIVADSIGNIHFQTISNSGTGNYLPLSGGTVSGDTIFDSLSASTLYVENEIWTIELMDAQTVDFYAPYNMSINSYSTVLSASSITFYDDEILYTTGNTIGIGSKITVSATSATVINLYTSH